MGGILGRGKARQAAIHLRSDQLGRMPSQLELCAPEANFIKKNGLILLAEMLNVVRPGAWPVATFGTSQKVEVFARRRVIIILKCDCKVSGRAVL